MLKKIIVEIVPLEEQRYETLGDYYYENDILHFKITDTGNDTYNKAILVHELVEELLTKHNGINEEDILKFDLWVADEVENGRYPVDAEPGEHPQSPYKKEHIFSENVERQIMNFLNIDFKEYDKTVISIFDNGKTN